MCCGSGWLIVWFCVSVVLLELWCSSLRGWFICGLLCGIWVVGFVWFVVVWLRVLGVGLWHGLVVRYWCLVVWMGLACLAVGLVGLVFIGAGFGG